MKHTRHDHMVARSYLSSRWPRRRPCLCNRQLRRSCGYRPPMRRWPRQIAPARLIRRLRGGTLLVWRFVQGMLWWVERLRATHGQAVGAWMLHEFVGPSCCFLCVYLGVLSTALLPVTLLAHLAVAPRLSVVVSPLAALPLAIHVFDRRAYMRWRAGCRAQLGARLLRACGDGVIWWRWWARESER